MTWKFFHGQRHVSLALPKGRQVFFPFVQAERVRSSPFTKSHGLFPSRQILLFYTNYFFTYFFLASPLTLLSVGSYTHSYTPKPFYGSAVPDKHTLNPSFRPLPPLYLNHNFRCPPAAERDTSEMSHPRLRD
jgi:hypothetical protein